MKKILPFILAALVPLTAHAQRQSVTVNPNGLGAGTFNTAGISYYFMGPNTYDFMGSTILNAVLNVTATAVSQTVSQANSFVAGEAVTINSGGTWVGASANSTLAAANAVGIVSSTGLSSTSFQVVIDGLCVVSGGSFTTSSIYYVPLAAGVVTSTAPSSVGQYVYPLATALSATVLSVSTSTPSIVSISNLTASGPPASTQLAYWTSATNLTGSASLTFNVASGAVNLGSGTTTAGTLVGTLTEGLQNTNAIATVLYGQNSNAGTTAGTKFGLANDSQQLIFTLTSSGYTGSPIVTGGIAKSASIYTDSTVPLILGTNGTLALTLDTSQNATFAKNLSVTGTSTLAAVSATTGTFSSTVSGAGITSLFASPPAIGSTTASTGAFTTLSASSTVNGTGFTNLFASPPAIGNTTASTGAFTTLSASSTVNGTGFTNLFAAPPAIGSTTASTGAFTTLAVSSTLTVSGSGAVNLGSGAITSTGSVVMNSATGGSQGAGTINATGLYVNGSSVSSPLASNNTWTGTNTFNNTVNGTGITALFASPPAIGGTLAAAGSFSALSSTGTTALGGAAGGISTPGMISIGNTTTVSGYALELHGSTPIVTNGGGAIQVNTQLTAAAANTYNFENFTPTFNTSTYTGNTLNSINVGTPTVNTTGGGTVTGGYQINVAAPASGQAGALNIASGAVNLGSGAITSTGSVVLNSATGGSQGAGTINATGLYVNGVSVGGSVVGSNNTWTGTNTFNNTVSGTGITSLFASPPAIGGTSAAAGNFTTLGISSTLTVSGSGAVNLGSGTTTVGGNLAVTGTSTLTGNVTIGAGGTASSNLVQAINGSSTAGFGPYTQYLRGGAAIGYVGSADALAGSGSTNNFDIYVANALQLLTNGGTLALTLDASQNATFAKNLSVTGHTTFEGVTSTGATGTGNLVYSASPTLTGTPAIAAATATTAGTNDTSTKVATTAYVSPATSTPTESAGAVTFDGSVARTFSVTLNANLTTVTLSNLIDGQSYVFALTNTASNYTVTWGNSIKWVGGSQPTQTIGAHTDVWTLVKIGTTLYGNAVQNF